MNAGDTVPEDERFQVLVTWLYHVEGLTQGAIAEHLGVTRLKVNRALADARRNGIVRISIHSRYAPCIDLAEELIDRFALKSASIAPAPSDDANVQPVIGTELGLYLHRLLGDRAIKRMAVGWGNTLNHAARAMTPISRPDMEIVSLMGSLPRGSDINSFEITTKIADLLAAERSYLTAPLYAGTEQSRDTFMVQDVFQDVFVKLRQSDLYAIGVGDLTLKSLLVRDGLPRDVTADDLKRVGAVGDILGYFIDAEGKPIDHSITKRVVGVSPYELRGRSNVILAAGGQHKVAVIGAALKTGIFDTLVTDERTARSILDAG
ncbi:MAG: sugar-binding transcriptional regulator [Pseudomonadota bacterium]